MALLVESASAWQSTSGDCRQQEAVPRWHTTGCATLCCMSSWFCFANAETSNEHPSAHGVLIEEVGMHVALACRDMCYKSRPSWLFCRHARDVVVHWGYDGWWQEDLTHAPLTHMPRSEVTAVSELPSRPRRMLTRNHEICKP